MQDPKRSGDSVTVLERELLAVASAARDRAYVPYSGFAVGAAVVSEDGSVFGGCNVENASYGLTNCAERTAIFSLVANGARRLRAIAVVADSPRPVPPCGACRQVLAEFADPGAWVILANLRGDIERTTVEQLLPYTFVREDMGDR